MGTVTSLRQNQNPQQMMLMQQRSASDVREVLKNIQKIAGTAGDIGGIAAAASAVQSLLTSVQHQAQFEIEDVRAAARDIESMEAPAYQAAAAASRVTNIDDHNGVSAVLRSLGFSPVMATATQIQAGPQDVASGVDIASEASAAEENGYLRVLGVYQQRTGQTERANTITQTQSRVAESGLSASLTFQLSAALRELMDAIYQPLIDMLAEQNRAAAEYRKQLKAFAERKYQQLLDKLAFAKKDQRMADAKAAGLKAASQEDNIFSLDAARAQRSANAQAMQVRQLQQELAAA